nr:hypothetical protein Iba_chr13fCG7730 [Ipomoea batatas]
MSKHVQDEDDFTNVEGGRGVPPHNESETSRLAEGIGSVAGDHDGDVMDLAVMGSTVLGVGANPARGKAGGWDLADGKWLVTELLLQTCTWERGILAWCVWLAGWDELV